MTSLAGGSPSGQCVRLQLDTAFAFDRDFEDEGFALYPPPLPRPGGGSSP